MTPTKLQGATQSRSLKFERGTRFVDVIQERVDLLPLPRTPWERHVPEANQSTILIPIERFGFSWYSVSGLSDCEK